MIANMIITKTEEEKTRSSQIKANKDYYKLQKALERFPRIAQVKTLQYAKKSFGKHWESDQDVVTARLLRYFLFENQQYG